MSEGARPSSGPTILIIDDDDITAIDIQTGLSAAGYHVLRARSGGEALVALKSTQADLILTRLMLPDTDGLILCATLKAYLPSPVIMLAAGAGDVDRALALESGAIGLLPIPIDMKALLSQVRTIVRAQSTTSAAGGQGSSVRR